MIHALLLPMDQRLSTVHVIEANYLDIVQLLAPMVDMSQADHDGTAPVHIALQHCPSKRTP